VSLEVFTKDNFDAEVLQSDKPVLVDFWASWCGPCKMIAPIVEELAGEYEGKIVVGKLNVDEHGEVPAKYGIMSIPTLILFKNGEEAERSLGYKTKDELAEIVKKVI